MKTGITYLMWLTAKGITTYQNYCNCGGYAWSMNGRNEAHPHSHWCAQFNEYEALYSQYEKEKANELQI